MPQRPCGFGRRLPAAVLSFGQNAVWVWRRHWPLNPRTLILDEITNGQDAVEKERMMSYLKALNEENGITVVLISHDMDTVRRYAQRTIVLHNGHLVFDGTPARLFDGSINVERWGLRCLRRRQLATRWALRQPARRIFAAALA